MSEKVDCDIVLLPNPDIKAAAIAKSRELSRQGSYFELGDETYVPHLSLYMIQIETANLPKAEGVLSEIAAKTRPLQLEAYRPYQSSGYVDVEYQRFETLDNLQMEVVNGLNPLRNGMYIDEINRMKVAEGIKLENLQKFGYQNIGELFRPHLTFTRLKSEIEFELDGMSKFSGLFSQLGLFEVGDYGTCVRKIKTFDLLS